MISAITDNLVKILVWWNVTDLSLEWTFLGAAINGVLGGTSMVLVNAYLVDKHRNKDVVNWKIPSICYYVYICSLLHEWFFSQQCFPWECWSVKYVLLTITSTSRTIYRPSS